MTPEERQRIIEEENLRASTTAQIVEVVKLGILIGVAVWTAFIVLTFLKWQADFSAVR